VDGGVVMKGSRRRKLYHDRGIFTAAQRQLKKTAQPWRVCGGLPAFAHEPAKHEHAGENRNTNQTLNNENQCKLKNQ
jgi:hypothetical protein